MRVGAIKETIRGNDPTAVSGQKKVAKQARLSNGKETRFFIPLGIRFNCRACFAGPAYRSQSPNQVYDLTSIPLL